MARRKKLERQFGPQDVLVIDNGFVPCGFISIGKAFSMWMRERAVWVENALDFDDPIKTIDKSYPFPRVIQLLEHSVAERKDFDGRFFKTPAFSRDQLYYLYDGVCQYCGRDTIFSMKKGSKNLDKTLEFSFDHVWPKSKGGTNSWDNAVCSCKGCNAIKGDLTIAELNKQGILNSVGEPFKVPETRRPKFVEKRGKNKEVHPLQLNYLWDKNR